MTKEELEIKRKAIENIQNEYFEKKSSLYEIFKEILKKASTK